MAGLSIPTSMAMAKAKALVKAKAHRKSTWAWPTPPCRRAKAGTLPVFFSDSSGTDDAWQPYFGADAVAEGGPWGSYVGVAGPGTRSDEEWPSLPQGGVQSRRRDTADRGACVDVAATAHLQALLGISSAGDSCDDIEDSDFQCLVAMEARESREGGFDSRNLDTFGDVYDEWSPDAFLEANAELARSGLDKWGQAPEKRAALPKRASWADEPVGLDDEDDCSKEPLQWGGLDAGVWPCLRPGLASSEKVYDLSPRPAGVCDDVVAAAVQSFADLSEGPAPDPCENPWAGMDAAQAPCQRSKKRAYRPLACDVGLAGEVHGCWPDVEDTLTDEQKSCVVLAPYTDSRFLWGKCKHCDRFVNDVDHFGTTRHLKKCSHDAQPSGVPSAEAPCTVPEKAAAPVASVRASPAAEEEVAPGVFLFRPSGDVESAPGAAFVIDSFYYAKGARGRSVHYLPGVLEAIRQETGVVFWAVCAGGAQLVAKRKATFEQLLEFLPSGLAALIANLCGNDLYNAWGNRSRISGAKLCRALLLACVPSRRGNTRWSVGRPRFGGMTGGIGQRRTASSTTPASSSCGRVSVHMVCSPPQASLSWRACRLLTASVTGIRTACRW